MNWCLTHECYTEFPTGFDGQCLVVACRPDDLEKNWIDTVSMPSPAELAVMDANAEELRRDFEG